MTAYLEHYFLPAPSSQSLNARRLRYPATPPAKINTCSFQQQISCLALFFLQVLGKHRIPPYQISRIEHPPSSPCASWPGHRSPSTASQAGTRILYWVRGNYRVRDNLALSVAMWLSTKLRMPLQASASESDYPIFCCTRCVDMFVLRRWCHSWRHVYMRGQRQVRGVELLISDRTLSEHCLLWEVWLQR